MHDSIIWSPGVSLEAVEEQVIKKALNHFRGNKVSTAAALGISVRTIDNKVAQYEAKRKLREEQHAERQKRNAEFLERSRGTVPEVPRIDAQPAFKLPASEGLPVSERDSVPELLPEQVTSFRNKG